MDTMLFVGFVASIILQGAHCFRVLEIDASSTAVLVGDDVSIKCTLTNYTEDDFVRWEKKFSNETFELATNRELNTKLYFTDLSRYSIRSSSLDLEGSVAKDYIMDIRDVQLNDAGEIGCSLSTSKVYVNLDVSAPVQHIYFSAKNKTDERELHDGYKLDFHQMENVVFVCETFDNYPAAEMNILLNGVPLATTKNETCYSVELLNHSFEGPLCDTFVETLTPLSEEQLLTMDTIECVAHNPLQDPPASISVNSFNKAPTIHCDDYMKILPYTDEFALTCYVNGTPPFEVIEWSWLMVEGGPRVALRPGQEKGLYSATAHEKDGAVITQLNIRKGFFQTFRNYKVFVSSRFGKDEANVFLEVDPNHTFFSSGGTNMPKMLALWMVVLISSLAWQ